MRIPNCQSFALLIAFTICNGQDRKIQPSSKPSSMASQWIGFRPTISAKTTVSVVKNGELFFSKGYSYADVEAKKEVSAGSTLFRIGSVSKLFVWTAVMQLVE